MRNHAAPLRNSRRLSERRLVDGRLVESRKRPRDQGFQRASRRAETVIAALQGFAIVCAMRERTAFPRAVIEALPDLKLLITTGMRNASIDLEAAKAHGVVVCGTPCLRQCHRRHRHRSDARTRAPHRLRERPAQGRRAVADHDRTRSRRPDARAPWPRQARHPHGRDRPGVQNERHRLEPEPHGGNMQASRRRACRPRRSFPPRGFPVDPCAIVTAHARADRRQGARPDEAERLTSSTPRAARSSTRRP